jgi:hypothetical protein
MIMTGVLLHPALIDAAVVEAARINREGDLPTSMGGARCSASREGVTIDIGLNVAGAAPLVAAARHRGGGEATLRGVLDVFCRVIEGLPLREAADHGAIHALDRLRDSSMELLVAGVLTTRSAGTAFTLCERLVRSVLAQYQDASGERATENFWNPPLSAEWRAKRDLERKAILMPILAEFRRAHGLGEDDLWLANLEKLRRVVIAFGPRVEHDKKARLLMRLEHRIRQCIGERLELYMEDMKDNNQIRRLGPSEAIA